MGHVLRGRPAQGPPRPTRFEQSRRAQAPCKGAAHAPQVAHMRMKPSHHPSKGMRSRPSSVDHHTAHSTQQRTAHSSAQQRTAAHSSAQQRTAAHSSAQHCTLRLQSSRRLTFWIQSSTELNRAQPSSTLERASRAATFKVGARASSRSFVTSFVASFVTSFGASVPRRLSDGPTAVGKTDWLERAW